MSPPSLLIRDEGPGGLQQGSKSLYGNPRGYPEASTLASLRSPKEAVSSLIAAHDE